jgi:hypothetical protein
MKKLLNELGYLRTDLEYKQEMLDSADRDFLKMLNDVLNSNKELKSQFEEKENINIEETLKKAEEKDKEEPNTDVDDNDDNSKDNNEDNEEKTESESVVKEKPKVEKSEKVKNLYRKIVKLTHPDKVDDKKLNELYLRASDSYDENDLSNLYTICNELGIDYEIEERDLTNLNTKVKELRNRSKFLEHTYTWKWMNAENKDLKNKIILDFIKMKIK